MFHANCDNKGPTVTVVRVRDAIFGGFLDQNWGGENKMIIVLLLAKSTIQSILEYHFLISYPISSQF